MSLLRKFLARVDIAQSSQILIRSYVFQPLYSFYRVIFFLSLGLIPFLVGNVAEVMAVAEEAMAAVAEEVITTVVLYCGIPLVFFSTTSSTFPANFWSETNCVRLSVLGSFGGVNLLIKDIKLQAGLALVAQQSSSFPP